MRILLPLLVLLLTETVARAKSGNEAVAQVGFGLIGCCASVPVLLVLALAILDWRTSRRTKPPPPGE